MTPTHPPTHGDPTPDELFRKYVQFHVDRRNWAISQSAGDPAKQERYKEIYPTPTREQFDIEMQKATETGKRTVLLNQLEFGFKYCYDNPFDPRVDPGEGDIEFLPRSEMTVDSPMLIRKTVKDDGLPL